MKLLRPLLSLLARLPAHVINGLGLAFGVGLVQIGLGAVFGHALALAATGGAIYASLADVPQAPARTWRRVLTGAALGCGVSVLVALARPQPWLLGMVIAAIGFATSMALAWGPRAGPLGFSAVLAVVFTLATPPSAAGHAPGLAMVALGGVVYTASAWLWSSLMQPRYRRLALAAVLASVGRLMQSRVTALIEVQPPEADAVRGLAGWLAHETALAERLQVARNLLYAAPGSAVAQAQIGVLLQAIDLHEMLQTSELDLELLGDDAAGLALRRLLATRSGEMAETLLRLERALRLHEPVVVSPSVLMTAPQPSFPAGDPRQRLCAALLRRLDDLSQCVARIEAGLQGLEQAAAQGVSDHGALPLAADAMGLTDLQRFVSDEGWPLAALRPHWRLASPVFRHALRVALAMGCAYFLASALPWKAHPYWLVLSVAVMLRGNLEQTLARRNARLGGTVAGCFVALGLAQVSQHMGQLWVLSLSFLASAALAHAYVVQRYVVTTMAGTVMALVQAHLAHPAAGLAVGERLVDTAIGALLAWAFCFVLPSWERRGAQRLVVRVADGLRRLAEHTLRWPLGGAADTALRLARREAFDALAAVALAARRTRVEPAAVRLPAHALANVVVQGQALLGHLLAVRVLLAHRRQELPQTEAETALAEAAADIASRLDASHPAGGAPMPTETAEVAAPGSGRERTPHDPATLPEHTPDVALLPWLKRRLQLAALEASRLARTVASLRDLHSTQATDSLLPSRSRK